MLPATNFLLPTDTCSSMRSPVALFLHGPRPPAASTEATYVLREHAGADRAAVEQFIAERFAASFGCRVRAFMPRLFSLRDQDGALCGACGLRSASRRLFLEQYLDAGIERLIARHSGQETERRAIVEVGHLSGNFPGAMRAMIRLLTLRLHREGFEWVAFTGTAGLRNAFTRMGLPLVDLRAADRERLPAEERAAWGNYYDHAPRVVAGRIRIGYEALVQAPSPALAGRDDAP